MKREVPSAEGSAVAVEREVAEAQQVPQPPVPARAPIEVEAEKSFGCSR